MSTAGRCPHLDPSEPPPSASGSLSGGGFPAPEAPGPLRASQSREVAELLEINQCTPAEVADLLDPDRNAADLAELLASIDRCTADLAALVLDADRYTAELAELLEGHGL